MPDQFQSRADATSRARTGSRLTWSSADARYALSIAALRDMIGSSRDNDSRHARQRRKAIVGPGMCRLSALFAFSRSNKKGGHCWPPRFVDKGRTLRLLR